MAEERLGALQNEWIQAQLTAGRPERESQWSEAVAVGRRSFVERVQEELRTRALYRQVDELDGARSYATRCGPTGLIRWAK